MKPTQQWLNTQQKVNSAEEAQKAKELLEHFGITPTTGVVTLNNKLIQAINVASLTSGTKTKKNNALEVTFGYEGITSLTFSHDWLKKAKPEAVNAQLKVAIEKVAEEIKETRTNIANKIEKIATVVDTASITLQGNINLHQCKEQLALLSAYSNEYEQEILNTAIKLLEVKCLEQSSTG